MELDHLISVIFMSHCLQHASSIISSHTQTTQHPNFCILLSGALVTHGAILTSKLAWEDIAASPGEDEWRLNVQTVGWVDTNHLDPHPEPANRGAAATLAKCIP